MHHRRGPRALHADEHGTRAGEVARQRNEIPRLGRCGLPDRSPSSAGFEPVVADISRSNGVALASLPGLGALGLTRRLRETVVALVGELVARAPGGS
jgi:hypothetical protein